MVCRDRSLKGCARTDRTRCLRLSWRSRPSRTGWWTPEDSEVRVQKPGCRTAELDLRPALAQPAPPENGSGRLAGILSLLPVAHRIGPVYYMSSCFPARKSANFHVFNSLFTIPVSPLSHPPDYSGGYSEGSPEGNSAGCPASYPERNPETCTDRNSVNYPGGNAANYWENRGQGYSAVRSAGCLDNRRASNRESNPRSNPAGNSGSYLENRSGSGQADARPGGAFGSDAFCAGRASSVLGRTA